MHVPRPVRVSIRLDDTSQERHIFTVDLSVLKSVEEFICLAKRSLEPQAYGMELEDEAGEGAGE